ncbi:MAG: heparinase II/III family protein [Planctomycetota bacterium]|nr:heparinase II/III family protein [Planctomycetota bacterium]
MPKFLKPTPINTAEAILDPLWDPSISGFKKWTLDDGQAHGLRVWQNWCWLSFEWANPPASGPALRMTRAFEADCSGYDKLLVSVMAPPETVCRLIAKTDKGERRFTSGPAPKQKKEHALDLQGAQVLHELTIEIDAAGPGVAVGWINWVGLQHGEALRRYEAMWDRFDPAWEGYLLPESYEPKFEPTLGLLIDKEELAALRVKHDAFLKEKGESPFTKAAAAAATGVPEKMVRDFVNFWWDTRYCRERDADALLLARGPVGNAVHLAVAGVLLKDKSLLRLAARYALSLSMAGRWDDGMICYFPGGLFEHRCFVQSLCVQELALVLDLAGEMLTWQARDHFKRRIAEEGLGAINFNAWKHEYIFHCNQLAWFTPGRMLGYLALERDWPRVKPYTELAHKDLVESLGYAILKDGGYVEGPTYFRCVGRDGGLSLYYYARARGKTLQEMIPDSMRSTADFGAAVASTDEEQDVVPICDGVSKLDQETLSIMAVALPQSAWAGMFRKSVDRIGGMADSLLACKLEADAPRTGPTPKPLVFLPEMGILSSTRRLGSEWVKLFIMGNKAKAGHTHEDKGSFILEFAGQTFAQDPGTTDYSDPMTGLLQKCERHNMLVPTGLTARPAPECPLPHDVKPVGQGDATRFDATIDATPGWKHYKKWVRTWDSPTPATIEITDEYELTEGGGSGVEFLWQTSLPIELVPGPGAKSNRATITGRRGRVLLEWPAGCSARIDEFPPMKFAYTNARAQRRLAIGVAGTAGKITVRVRLESKA